MDKAIEAGPTGTYTIQPEIKTPTDKETAIESTGSTPLSETGNELRTAADGKTILIPQPSNDPDDPLNWSPAKKRCILGVLCVAALLTDWGMTWGAPLFQAQAVTWKMSVQNVSASLSGGIFLQGAGGLFAVPLTQRFGRLPVLFWSQFLSCIIVIAASLAPTYAGFTACRTIQGIVNTAPQIIGLSIIHDMYFFHQHARKINIWGASFLLGPYLGPFISGMIITKLDWRADFGILAAFYGFSFILIILLGDETLYDRGEEKQQLTSTTGVVRKLQLLSGFAGARAKGRPSVITSFLHTLSIGIRPHVFLISFTFYMLANMWAVGLATTIPVLVHPPPYEFGPKATALLYLAPAIGAFVGEAWGHFFNEFIFRSYLRRHNGKWLPEQRLWAVYPSVIVTVCALVLIGQCLERGLHWVGLAFGWAMYNVAAVTATVAISAYVLDCFPYHAALVSSIVNFWRTTGGFCVVYFQFKWVEHNGAAVTFGCQAAIVAGGFLGVIATQIWGPKWREMFPPPAAEN
ncbi:MFS general substrate transporter [Xylona heveae TC161]|uniref:MFS general substrate transporter n=1 Tax=Xylona heveae (strain CBS 132557 / TC161) TaxID=1328760 RepID=A0A165J6D0_XYLHT|nr:MFS general substrate transporter [Xylona heveae TC161]KZF25794.1 MFS general substrate transporter [Xylona heveae TC161]